MLHQKYFLVNVVNYITCQCCKITNALMETNKIKCFSYRTNINTTYKQCSTVKHSTQRGI